MIVLEGARGEGTVGWDEVEGADPDFDAEPHWRAVDPEDVLTLIYTSGTTGPAEGRAARAPQHHGRGARGVGT